MKDILVTGGAGLVGSCINFGKKPTRKELDVCDFSSLCKFIEENNIKRVVHCAARVGGVKANNDFVFDFFYENISMNINILKAVQKYNILNTIQILSTCVFPEYANLPLKETYIHNGEPHPTNFGYAYAKRMLEVGSRAIKRQNGNKYCCLIPTNIYGKNDNYNLESSHVVPALIHKCYLAKVNNTKFEVWGSGKPEREFIFAEDFAKIIELSINKNDMPGMVMVSNGISIKIEDVVGEIVKLMKFKGKVVFDSSKPEGILKKPTDCILFKTIFPEFTFTPIDEGLDATIEYFIKNYKNIRK